MSEPGVVADIKLPVGCSTVAAWCPSTNLIAVAAANQGPASSVIVLEPSCPQDHCVLNAPLKGPNDYIKSLSWSPLHSRHALLAASQQGGLWVWTQIPPDIPGTPHVPTTNQWFSQQLDPPFTALDVQGTDFTGAAGLVCASWLTPPAQYMWSTPRLANEPLPTHLDDLFLGPSKASGGGPLPRHWVRPGILTAAVVDSQAGCRLYTATLGRYPNQLHWHMSARLPLIPLIDVSYQATAASITTTLLGTTPGVRVAVLGASSPTTIHICNISGNPAVQGSHVPPHQQLTATVLECIDILATPTQHPIITPVALSFCTNMTGQRLYVLGQSADAQTPAGHMTHVVVCQEQPAIPGTAEPATWNRIAQHVYCAHGQAEAGTFAATSEGSKVAFVSSNTLHVLSSEDHALIHTRTLDALPPAAAQPPASPAAARALTAVFSPLSCCLAVVSTLGGTASGQVVKAGAGGSAAKPVPQLNTSRVRVLAVPDMQLGSSPAALFASPGRPPCWTASMSLTDSSCEVHARLEASRMLWSLLRCTPMWCMVQRLVALSQHHAGWAYAFRCLAIFDEMLQSEDNHPRPSYSQLADRVKISVLRCVPGYTSACVQADLVARQYVGLLYQVLTSCVQTPSDGSNPASARTISPVEAAACKNWLSWFGDYVQLMLASFKAWSAARSSLPQQLFPRAPHSSQSNMSDLESAESAAAVAEEEGAGAAWAYMQEVNEAGGPLSADEAAVALPCVRLLLDRKFLTNMRYCMHVWSSVRARPPAGLAAAAEEKESEEAASARHSLTVTIKQLFTSVEGLLSLGNVKGEGGQSQSQGRQPTPRELSLTLSHLYPGRAHVHAGRCTLVSTWAHLQPLLSSPGVLSAPSLTPRQILARARELGLLLASPPNLSSLDHTLDPSSILASWHSCRRQAPPASSHHDLLLLDSHMLPGHADAPTAKPGAETASTTDLLHSPASPGASLSPGWSAGQAAKKRARWYQQRAVSLAVNDPSNPRSELRQRSSVAGDAMECHLPVLDMLSGVLLHPGLCVWSTEASDGSGCTAQLEDTYLQVVAQQPNSVQFLRKAWISVSPVTGVPWKKVRTAVAQETTIPVW